MKPFLAALLLAAPGLALAQSAPESGRAYALILPMIQELAPGRPGEVLAACALATAEPAEAAALEAAPAPSEEVGAVLSAILAREAAISCFQANMGG
jgi:hypothetical protein